MPKNTRFFTLLLLIGSLGQVAADLYLPSLPAMQTTLHTSITWVQYSVSAYMIGFALSQLPYGPLSDAIGRKKPLIFGLCLLIIGSIICSTATSINQVIIGRLLQGIGGGAGITLTRAILRDRFSGIELAKISSYLAGGRITIMASAPLVGGFIQEHANWQSNFIVIGLYAMISLAICLFWLPETNQHQNINYLKPKQLLHNMKTVICNRVFISMSFLVMMVYGSILAWLTAGPILLQLGAGASPVGFGLAALITGMAAGCGTLINGRLVGVFGIKKMLRAGLTIMLTGALSMLIIGVIAPHLQSWQLVVPMSIFMCGASFIFANAIATALNPFPKHAGIAGSLSAFIQLTGGALASAIIAHLPETTQLPLAITITTAAILAWIIFLNCKKQIG